VKPSRFALAAPLHEVDAAAERRRQGVPGIEPAQRRGEQQVEAARERHFGRKRRSRCTGRRAVVWRDRCGVGSRSCSALFLPNLLLFVLGQAAAW
jgi:hypothetical protein